MMNNSSLLSVDNNSILAGYFPAEKISGISDLCRELVSTNTLDVLLNSIVRQSVDILQVRFSRILTLEPDGTFLCQASFSPDSIDLSYRRKLRSNPIVQSLYQSAVLRETPLILEHGSALPNDLRMALRIGLGDSLYLVPLRVNQESLGILALGEERKTVVETILKEKLHLATLIADQAAGAIYRSRLSYRLEESQLQTVLALAKVMESRDPDTGNHSRKVTAVAVRLARKLDCSPAEEQVIRWAAMLHDIGKVGIRDDILKKKGTLEKKEWELMRRHPEMGADIVRMSSNLNYVATLIQAHHERYDGTGYPYGLQREMIPFGARILAVADAFSAMTDQTHQYHEVKTLEEAISEMQRCSGTQFDPKVVEAFVALFS
jgi:putative nucleotidyltransferase with HDIG domain